MRLTVLQMLPALESGGVERGTLEVAQSLVQAGHRSIVVAAGGRLVDSLLKTGSEHIDWSIGAKSPLTLRYVFKLRQLLRAQAVDILHARSRLPAWIAWLAWRSLPVAQRPRFVTTVHGAYSINHYSRIMTRGERVIAVSDYIRAYILDNYPGSDANCVHVIPRGVDPAVYPYGYQPDATWLGKWRAQYPQLSDKKLIALPARLTRRKGQRDLIQIFQALRQRGGLQGLHGLIIGDGHDACRAELQQRIHDAGLDQDITLCGHREDVREIMAISSVVLSLSNMPEAFGRTVLEALSLGRPVIGYAHGGVGEILQRLYPRGGVVPGDIDTVCSRLREFVHQPAPVPREQPYTLQCMLQATLALYQALAADIPGNRNLPA